MQDSPTVTAAPPALDEQPPPITGLSAEAARTIDGYGIDPLAYVRHFNGRYLAPGFDRTVWHGDSCGCEDDRCIGFHHDLSAECGCLEPTIDRFLEENAGKVRTHRAAAITKLEHSLAALDAAVDAMARLGQRDHLIVNLEITRGDLVDELSWLTDEQARSAPVADDTASDGE